MPIWKLAKALLLLFWVAALVNVLMPFPEPLGGRLGWLAGIILIAHVVEMLLFNRRLQARPQPWLERLQVLAFGFVHLRSLR
ncbi:MAG: DUF1145 domain-containing protein [Pseudomonas sp.]|uniref:DUF1145 domain-containing protein n=1 Tax=Pseudomonas sp. TaxID=306 RepID=UPI0027363ABE|nr:DUF1145 domain-containing protein [Pseudomonas sp.]MDP3846527.1 DUF1145 domain-containing protein [Pseudomonas sp.]